MRESDTRLYPDLRGVPAALVWFRTLRVRDWAHFLLLPIAGFAGDVLALSRGLVIALCILAFGFLLNGIADSEMDGSARKNPLVAVRDHAMHLRVSALLATTALGVALLAPRPAAIATAIAVASGTLYSIGPRLKRLPIIGTLSNVLHFAPLLWVGIARHGPHPGMWALTGCFSLLILQNQILHEAADELDDRPGAVNTTWRLLGRRSGAVLVTLLGLSLALVVAGQAELRAGAPVLALALGAGFGLAVLLLGQRRHGAARLRKAHRFLAGFAGAWMFFALRFA
jgi:4-hydroxybenzoate polyprenyltransferase